jgi:flavin-dependent dehydrogenase
VREVKDSYDAIVVGGGPAGAGTAGLLAAHGHRVLVLEREKFPRYHIGESLIPGCLPIVEELGLWDRLANLGFTRKYGATLLWGETMGLWDFRFADGGGYEYSYQVRRADFDALLLARAREFGAHVLEEITVKEFTFDGDRATGVSFAQKGQDASTDVAARLIVDASGQGRMLGRKLGLVEWHEDLRNVAVWTYFEGCKYLEGRKAGDVLVENRPQGWFWFIPLSDGTVSVGYVTRVDALQQSNMPIEELFATQRADSEEIRRLTEGSRQVSSFRTIRDWSYNCRQFHGPGWALVGDAAAFVDPLFSTGVALALRGASSLATHADRALRDPSAEQDELAAYESDYRDFLDQVLEFVRFFYNTAHRKEQYWDGAQSIVDPAKMQPPKIDFAALLSGMTGTKPRVEAIREAEEAYRQVS